MTFSHPTTSIVLASSNAGKLRELQHLLPDRFRVVSAHELGVRLPEETGQTFAENAVLKATATYAQTGLVALADDSGLEVDALNGEPGVYSARYAGVSATDEENNGKLLQALTGVPGALRSARFRSAIAIQLDAETVLVFEGSYEGVIGLEPRGNGGFGYDPLFSLPNGRTMAELTPEEKSAVSHRGEAMRKAIPVLLEHLAARADQP